MFLEGQKCGEAWAKDKISQSHYRLQPQISTPRMAEFSRFKPIDSCVTCVLSGHVIAASVTADEHDWLYRPYTNKRLEFWD